MSETESGYANEDVLVSADWAEEHLDAFQSDDPAYRIVEGNSPEQPEEDFPSRYDEGHIPGAIGFQWDEDRSDDVERDILSKADFEEPEVPCEVVLPGIEQRELDSEEIAGGVPERVDHLLWIGGVVAPQMRKIPSSASKSRTGASRPSA